MFPSFIYVKIFLSKSCHSHEPACGRPERESTFYGFNLIGFLFSQE